MARPATLDPALRDVDRAMLISSADPTMLEVQSNFIDAAAKAGVEHLVKLSGIRAKAAYLRAMLSPDRGYLDAHGTGHLRRWRRAVRALINWRTDRC